MDALPSTNAPEGLEPSPASGGLGLLEAAWQRKSLVLLGVVVGLLVGLLYYFQARPVYQSKAQLLVVKKQSDSVPGLDTRPHATEDYVGIHKTLLESPLLIEQAARKTNLAAHEAYANEEDLTETLKKALSVSRSRTTGTTSNTLDLAFRAPTATVSRTFLDALLDSYKEFLDVTYRNTSEKTLQLVLDARDVLHKDIQTLQADHRKFRKEAPLLLLRTKDGGNLTQEKLSGIEAKRTALRVRRAEIQGHLAALDSGLKRGVSREALLAMSAAWTGKGEGDTSNQSERLALQNQLSTLLQEEQKLLETHGEAHPEVLALHKRIEVVRSFLTDPAAPWRKALDKPDAPKKGDTPDPVEMHRQYFQQQLSNLEVSEKLLDDLYKEEYEAARALMAFEDQDEAFRTDIANKEKLYENMLKQLHDVDLVKNFGGYDARIIGPPTAGKKVEPKALLVFPAGLLLGLVLGFGLAYLAEVTDKSFRSIDEVRRRLGVPVVGHIPFLRPADKGKKPAPEAGPAPDPVLCMHYNPGSVAAECYRGVRTALYFSTHGIRHKVIQITSPNARDGKSTLAANLAVSIAHSGQRVVLVDADLRMPQVHTLFGIPAGEGLVSVLAGEAEPKDVLCETCVPGLSLLPCGPLPPNPAELLTSPRFKELLDLLRDEFDFVIVDTPPLLAVTDPSVVAPRVDGVILTVRITRNSRPAAERAREVLRTLGATVVGVVVNGVDRQAQPVGYGYGSSYGPGDGAGAGTTGEPSRAGAETVP